MKLYKKAAACLLTAAMARSMLTACGGGGGTPNKPGGNTPSTLPTNPDEIVLPDIGEGEGGGEGTETKPTKTPIIDVNSSKLAQFNKRYAGATEFCVEVQQVGYDEDGSVAESMDGSVARKGEDYYVRMTGLDEDQKQQLIEILMRKNNKSTWDQYLLLRSSKVAVNTGSTDEVDMSLSTLIADKLPDQMWSTKVKVGPTEYYAEVYNAYSSEYTICYTPDGKPVYEFVRDLKETQLERATLYKTIQAGSGSSKGLCELPRGFKIYSKGEKNGQLIDANGKVFTVEPQDNGAFKVFDQTGKDVTADFK